MRVFSIVGARPQFVKIAPVCRAIDAHNASGAMPIENVIVHTGQHYDPAMSDVFFEELEIPRADVHLGVGSGGHGDQTGRMLIALESLFLQRRPDVAVVYGDTNSTIAGALAATKLGIPVVHVEAGLRSFNRAMPEELNRVATDHLSDLLLAPTPTAMRNLAAEALGSRSVFTGDVMYDAVLFNRRIALQRSDVLARFALKPREYAVVTIHRAENTRAEQVRAVLDVLNDVAGTRLPLVFPVHPRMAKLLQAGIPGWSPHARLRLIEPLGYLDMLCLVHHARIVLTDSGGLQKEALFLGRPCVTLRRETEWVETVEIGANVVAGTERDAVLGAVDHWLGAGNDEIGAARIADAFGNGSAAERIVSEIVAFASQSRAP